MKRVNLIFVVVAIIIATSSASAQLENSFWTNLFLQGQLGISHTFGENFQESSYSEITTPHLALSVGKSFTSQFLTRVQVAGWESKSCMGKNTINYFQINADGLINATNLFIPSDYNERIIDVIIFAGVGYVHALKNDKAKKKNSNHIIPRGGVQIDYKLNKDLSINLEVAGNLMPDAFNGVKTGISNDGTFNVLLGLTYKLNMQYYKKRYKSDDCYCKL